jgi:hypothetical protein
MIPYNDLLFEIYHYIDEDNLLIMNKVSRNMRKTYGRISKYVDNMIIRKFRIKHIRDVSSSLIIANRKLGASTLIRDIMYHKRDISAGVVISATNEFYEKDGFIPSPFIHSECTTDLMDRFRKRQNNVSNQIDPRAYFIYDGMCHMNSFRLNIPDFISNVHAYNTLYIGSMNIYSLLRTPESLCSISDYLFIFGENRISLREKLWEKISYYLPKLSYQLFSNILDTIMMTNKFNCLVIDNTALDEGAKNIRDILFWYKAKIHKPFRVGIDVSSLTDL